MALTNGLLGLDTQPTVGETNTNVPDILTPAVQGSFYLKWLRLPDFVDKQAWEEIMRTLVNKVTINGVTIGTADAVNGFSGTTKLTAPTNVEVTNELPMGINELQGLGVLNHIEKWVYTIRDPLTGLSHVTDYSIRNISGDLLVILTKPVHSADKSIIEKAFLYKNLFPTNIPYDTLAPNKETSDKIAYETTWKYKNQIVNDQIIDYAAGVLPELVESINKWDEIKITE